jgi:hypothetical protein
MCVIMAATNCSPAVASRRAKYFDDFRVPTLLIAQPLDAKQCLRRLFQIRLNCSRGESCTTHQADRSRNSTLSQGENSAE